MRAQPKANADWAKARARRAAAGKAPRLALVRIIILRGHDADRWSVAIWTKRYGVWQRPERLCSRVSLKRAEATILSAWRSCRLPLAQHGADDRHLRPFYLPDAYHALGRR